MGCKGNTNNTKKKGTKKPAPFGGKQAPPFKGKGKGKGK